jgi:glyoxylate/hydroxypyruvate reductase A
MSNYCIAAIEYLHRRFDKYRIDKSEKRWDQAYNPEREINIGILGLGVLGTDLARKLVALGFFVFGVSKSKKEIPGVISFTEDQMEDFLGNINTLICMLPATKETQGILNMDLFKKMKKGSYLINVARGEHQVEEDILKALDEGIFDGVFLDVFEKEPLPKDHPFWDHKDVFITPHIACITKTEAAIPQIAENYRLMQVDEPLVGVVDRNKGY